MTITPTKPTKPTRPAGPGGTVLVSAHRGGRGQGPRVENSWATFEAAVQMPCEYVEFDVNRTADGDFVIHHDHRVTVDGRRVRVDQIPAVALDAAVGRRVRLTEVLDLLRAHDKKAHLDLKFTSCAAAYATPAALRDWADQEGVWCCAGSASAVGCTVSECGRRSQPGSARCSRATGSADHGPTWWSPSDT